MRGKAEDRTGARTNVPTLRLTRWGKARWSQSLVSILLTWNQPGSAASTLFPSTAFTPSTSFAMAEKEGVLVDTTSGPTYEQATQQHGDLPVRNGGAKPSPRPRGPFPLDIPVLNQLREPGKRVILASASPRRKQILSMVFIRSNSQKPLLKVLTTLPDRPYEPRNHALHQTRKPVERKIRTLGIRSPDLKSEVSRCLYRRLGE